MIDQNPMGEELDSFGLAYHGLYVYEPDGTSYIRLKNGRRIYPSGSGYVPPSARPEFGVSALVDNDMPPVSLALDDPDAELWNVAISVLYGSGSPMVYPFHYRRNVRYRRDPASGELVEPIYRHPQPTINLVTDWGSKNVHIVTPYESIQPYRVTISQSEHGLPDKFFGSNFHTESVVMSVAKDGCRFLIRVDAKVRESVYGSFIAEITVGNKFTTASASVVAKYDSLVSGGGGRVEGDPGEVFARVTNLETGAVTWDVPYSPDLHEIYQWPEYSFFTYAVGTSSATSTGEPVIGAWYTPTGGIELVRARWSVTQRITASRPVPQLIRPHDWMSPFTIVDTATLTIVTGGKATAPITITMTHSRPGPASGTVTLSTSTDDSFSRTYTPYFAAEDATLKVVLATAEADLYQGYGLVIYADGGVELSLQSRPEGGVYMPGLTISNSQNNYQEIIAGDCITPKGVDSGVKRSGNVYASGIGQFMRAAYNPVTGEVERNRTDGATYAWV